LLEIHGLQTTVVVTRALDASGPVTGAVLSPALLLELCEKQSNWPSKE